MVRADLKLDVDARRESGAWILSWPAGSGPELEALHWSIGSRDRVREEARRLAASRRVDPGRVRIRWAS